MLPRTSLHRYRTGNVGRVNGLRLNAIALAELIKRDAAIFAEIDTCLIMASPTNGALADVKALSPTCQYYAGCGDKIEASRFPVNDPSRYWSIPVRKPLGGKHPHRTLEFPLVGWPFGRLGTRAGLFGNAAF